MLRDKYDIFVCPVPNPDPVKNEHFDLQQRLLNKLYDALYANYGVEAVIPMENAVEDKPYTEEELVILNQQPFYISEHYLTGVVNLDPITPANRHICVPFRCRPAPEAYNYAHNGSYAINQWRVIGRTNTGKGLLIRELVKVLEENVPGCKIVICENPYGFHNDEFDPLADPETLAYVKERFSRIKVAFTKFPRWGVDVDNKIYHDVNL